LPAEIRKEVIAFISTNSICKTEKLYKQVLLVIPKYAIKECISIWS
jgi:hypothetical protein